MTLEEAQKEFEKIIQWEIEEGQRVTDRLKVHKPQMGTRGLVKA